MIEIKVDTTGLQTTRAILAGLEKQVRFAASKALTKTAYAVNAEIKEELRRNIKGGPTPYTLRAFKADMARPETLTASVSLRDDAPAGGGNYKKTLKHIFTGGARSWKKLEDWLRARRLLPSGMMIAPGPKVPLDWHGNMRRAAMAEFIGILSSQVRNLRVYRKAGAGKWTKGIGFFVCLPGDKSGLAPGIWRRIETGSASAVEPWIMYIRPVEYKRQFDLGQIARKVVGKTFQENYDRALADAIRTAR